VTREENSSIVTHAGHKWQLPKWVPSAWGYSWATLPWGLQILWTGPPGWGLGLQPITITELTVRKPKLWPQKER